MLSSAESWLKARIETVPWAKEKQGGVNQSRTLVSSEIQHASKAVNAAQEQSEPLLVIKRACNPFSGNDHIRSQRFLYSGVANPCELVMTKE